MERTRPSGDKGTGKMWSWHSNQVPGRKYDRAMKGWIRPCVARFKSSSCCCRTLVGLTCAMTRAQVSVGTCVPTLFYCTTDFSSQTVYTRECTHIVPAAQPLSLFSLFSFRRRYFARTRPHRVIFIVRMTFSSNNRCLSERIDSIDIGTCTVSGCRDARYGTHVSRAVTRSHKLVRTCKQNGNGNLDARYHCPVSLPLVTLFRAHASKIGRVLICTVTFIPEILKSLLQKNILISLHIHICNVYYVLRTLL